FYSPAPTLRTRRPTPLRPALLSHMPRRARQENISVLPLLPWLGTQPDLDVSGQFPSLFAPVLPTPSPARSFLSPRGTDTPARYSAPAPLLPVLGLLVLPAGIDGASQYRTGQ